MKLITVVYFDQRDPADVTIFAHSQMTINGKPVYKG